VWIPIPSPTWSLSRNAAAMETVISFDGWFFVLGAGWVRSSLMLMEHAQFFHLI